MEIEQELRDANAQLQREVESWRNKVAHYYIMPRWHFWLTAVSASLAGFTIGVLVGLS